MLATERRSRADRGTAQVVNTAILISETDGRRAAAHFMDQHRVPFRVIVRVLADPDRRRPQPPQR